MGKRIIGNSLLQAVSYPFNLEQMFRVVFTSDELRKMSQVLSEEGNKQTLLDHLLTTASDSNGISNFEPGLEKLAQFKEPAFGGLFDMG